MFLRRLEDDGTLQNTKEAMNRLTVPQNETLIKREGINIFNLKINYYLNFI